MVIELNRADIESAIKKYVEEEIIGYGKKGEFTYEVTQAKSAKATVTLVAKVVDISE